MSSGELVTPLQSRKVKRLWGNVMVPGDKSISHRALIFGSQMVGVTRIKGLLEGEDVMNTAGALRQLGVKIEQDGTEWVVTGVGVGGLTAPSKPVDMGNSGTAARLLMGLVASYPFETTFIGDASLSRRPMGRVITPLKLMGVDVEASEGGTMPLTIKGSASLAPITYTSPVASAQLKSCVLLAGLNIAGKTAVIEPVDTRAHTEKMLKYLGADVNIEKTPEGTKITVTGQGKDLDAQDIVVPADPSSAAFLVVAGAICADAEVTVRDVMLSRLRAGLFVTLEDMGANIEYIRHREESGEKIADLVIKTSSLKGVDVPADRAPSMIDEYPILAIAAACAEGKTVMRGLHELRVKESDRLQAVYNGLIACGVKAEIDGDDLIIEGGGIVGGATIETQMDHRLAMSFLVAGMVSDRPITIDDGNMINTSFTGFRGLMNAMGADIHKL
jgi:3-phosphoshikimate 1-carboxyvinyltransferase